MLSQVLFQPLIITSALVLIFIFCSGELIIDETEVKTGNMSRLTTTTADTDPDWVQVGFDRINEYRVIHKAPNLTLNRNLLELSVGLAKEILEEDPNSKDTYRNWDSALRIGIYNTQPAPHELFTNSQKLIDSWYRETKAYFNYESCSVKPSKWPDDHGSTVLFTQMLWKNTTKVGLGYASSDDNQTVVVATFHPMGNYLMQFYCYENIYMPGLVRPKWDEEEWGIFNSKDSSSYSNLSSSSSLELPWKFINFLAIVVQIIVLHRRGRLRGLN